MVMMILQVDALVVVVSEASVNGRVFAVQANGWWPEETGHKTAIASNMCYRAKFATSDELSQQRQKPR